MCDCVSSACVSGRPHFYNVGSPDLTGGIYSLFVV